MNDKSVSLCTLNIGEKGKIKNLTVNGLMRRRLLDLGVINNTQIEALYKSPFGDPVAYFIRGTVIALRKDIASQILIEKL